MKSQVFRGNNSFTKNSFSPQLHPFNQSFSKSPNKSKGETIQLNRIPLRNKGKTSVDTSNSNIKISPLAYNENIQAKINYKKPLHKDDIDRKQVKAIVPVQKIVERLRGNIKRLESKIQVLFREEITEEKQLQIKHFFKQENSKISTQRQQSKLFKSKDESLLTESDRLQSRLRIQSILTRNQIQRKYRKQCSKITRLSNGSDF